VYHIDEALLLVLAMGAVILFCRVLPFLLFSGGEAGERKKNKALGAFLDFVEKTVPPAAMTVLAFNALGGAFADGKASGGLVALGAAALTALLHLWKRNALISILGGTVLYMLLS